MGEPQPTPCTCNRDFQPILLPRLTKAVELRALLRSNDYPTKLQAAHCEEVLSDSSAELERYTAEALKLKAALAQIERDRVALEDYSQLCRFVLSPIRRLPSEILIEIFAFFLPDIPNWGGPPFRVSDLDPAEEELRRVANVDLLRISQVCPRWHRLVMGTSSLWSTVSLNLEIRHSRPILSLLKSSLERGCNSPMDVGVFCEDRCSLQASALLNLLVQYSRQWKDLTITMGPFMPYSALDAVKGNLPLLQSLRIDTVTTENSRDTEILMQAISSFQVAPRLTALGYRGPLGLISYLPLEQLKVLVCLDFSPKGINELVSSIMPRLSDDCSCQLRIHDSDDDPDAPQTQLSAVTSNISQLSLGGTVVTPDSAEQILLVFTRHLILPRVFKIEFPHSQYQELPLRWPQREFCALAERSSFSTNLVTLSLEAVFITEIQLLQTLSDLRVLEELTISDHRVVDGAGEELVLITDSLLRHLTWSANPTCLVPKLSYFECHTLLRFDDTVYRDFTLSRLTPGRNSAGPFELELQWYPECTRELDSAVMTQFADLIWQGQLLFACYESDIFPDFQADLVVDPDLD
ncbi:hypothetical protein C8R46DRAFT_32746 [Mycena filopes]|nr:hypothetical protein C8R46DRAFT_32746 [Mycena filopes]